MRQASSATTIEPDGTRRGRLVVALALIGGSAGYAAWLSGVRPFSPTSYLAVALPVAAIGVPFVAAHGRARRQANHPADPRPRVLTAVMLGIAVIAVGLEAAGLALGGRSLAVPTVSTVADHALRWRALRAALVTAWLVVLWRPLLAHAPRPGRED